MLSLSPLSPLPASLHPPHPFLTLIQCTQPAESEGRSRNRNEGIHDVLPLSLSHSQSLLPLSLSFILSLSSNEAEILSEKLSYIINGDKCTSVQEFNHDFCSIKGACTLKNVALKRLCVIIDHLCNSAIYSWHICSRLLGQQWSDSETSWASERRRCGLTFWGTVSRDLLILCWISNPS